MACTCGGYTKKRRYFRMKMNAKTRKPSANNGRRIYMRTSQQKNGRSIEWAICRAYCDSRIRIIIKHPRCEPIYMAGCKSWKILLMAEDFMMKQIYGDGWRNILRRE